MVLERPVVDAGDDIADKLCALEVEHLRVDRERLDRKDVDNRVPDLPILGEPLIPEFANTLYIDGTTRLDVLDRPTWIAAWLQQAPCAVDLPHPKRVRTEDAEQLRALRDSIRGLLTFRRDGRAAGIAVINAAARAGVSQRLLASTVTGELEVTSRTRSSGIDDILLAIALEVIDAVERGLLDLNQLCSRPGCNLFYFRDHRRRRYCNSRCANADRQARYNARRREPTRTDTAAR